MSIAMSIKNTELKEIKDGKMTQIKRPLSKFYKNMFLEPVLDENEELIWIPKKDTELVAFSKTLKNKTPVGIKNITKTEDTITVHFEESKKIRIFGGSYANENTLVEDNYQDNQIKGLIEMVQNSRNIE
ncbi:MAG: hypothetical protein DRI86_00885 [Bacteroidetes bacterium]|nr:MAG: hypothetical protein DRI86_00885 [Bacteroidota bacterium]